MCIRDRSTSVRCIIEGVGRETTGTGAGISQTTTETITITVMRRITGRIIMTGQVIMIMRQTNGKITTTIKGTETIQIKFFKVSIDINLYTIKNMNKRRRIQAFKGEFFGTFSKNPTFFQTGKFSVSYKNKTLVKFH